MLQPPDQEIVARDPALPGLAVVLDADTVSALLGKEAEPVHLRYKPGVSCMATFRVDGDFVILRALTRQRFSNDKISPRRAALMQLVPEHALIIMPPAADRRITAMRNHIDLSAATPLRFKPERRMVLRKGDAMLKAMSEATWDRALCGARFGATLGGPDVLSVDEQNHMIATRWLHGTSAENAGPEIFSRIGATLAALHQGQAGLPLSTQVAPPAALADLERLLPELTNRIRRIRTGLALALSVDNCLRVPCHGDFSADQVMVAPDGRLTIIDWDEAGLANPATDLGSFLARLDHDSLIGVQTQNIAEAFIRGYGPQPAGVAAHHAAALAALATEGFRTRRADWPDLACRLLDRVEQILPPVDPLSIAADPAAMTQLSGLKISNAVMIRLKPGKRALFRYDEQFIAKMRFKGSDRATPALHDRLRAAGLDGSGDTGVPQPRSSIDALNLWLQDLVPGRILTDLIAPDGPVGPFHAAGRGLARLHVTNTAAIRDWTLRDELEVMKKALDRPELRDICERLCGSVNGLPESPICGIHRDFYPDQVLIDNGRVWLLDLDLYANGDPAIDLGNFLAHLDEFALRQGWGCPALMRQAEAFLAGYVSLRALPANVSQMRAISLARHIKIAESFPDRQHTPPLIQAHLGEVIGSV